MKKEKTRIYIAGSITNNPNYVKQFREAEQMLKKNGFRVLNPIHNTGNSYKKLIDKGLAMLQTCDAIYMLPGWKESKGATLEYTYAKTVGIKIIFGTGGIKLNKNISNKNIETKLNEIIEQNESTNLLIGAISDSLSRIEDALKDGSKIKTECSATGITIPYHEYARLKDIETRFTIMRGELLHTDYIPIHHQIVLGIEKEYAAKHLDELNADMFPEK